MWLIVTLTITVDRCVTHSHSDNYCEQTCDSQSYWQLLLTDMWLTVTLAITVDRHVTHSHTGHHCGQTCDSQSHWQLLWTGMWLTVILTITVNRNMTHSHTDNYCWQTCYSQFYWKLLWTDMWLTVTLAPLSSLARARVGLDLFCIRDLVVYFQGGLEGRQEKKEKWRIEKGDKEDVTREEMRTRVRGIALQHFLCWLIKCLWFYIWSSSCKVLIVC